MRACASSLRPATASAAPRKKYSERFTGRAARGSVQRACGAMRIVQIATSVSLRAAHDFGGGAGARADANWPAATVTSVARPSASRDVYAGTSSRHSIVKCGSAILSAAGRLSQIWNSSTGFGPARSRSGNISECTMPRPAVSHCTSPRPKRAVAPSESE